MTDASTHSHLRQAGSSLSSVSAAVAALTVSLVVAGVGLSVGLARLHEQWLDEYSYSHGYLILAMSIWLGIQAVRATSNLRVKPSLAGLGFLGLCVFGYLLAQALDFTLGMQVMLPPILLGIFASIGGLALAQVLLLPIGFLYFAIPVWDVSISPLQQMATWAVTSALGVTDITVFIEGSRVSTSAGTFEIGDACAGQRFFVVGLALAAFYGLNWYRRWRTRLLLFVVAGAVSVLSNWIRVYALILIGHYTEMQHYLIAEDHYLFGWAIFTVMMVPVFWLARRLELGEGASASEPEPGAVSCTDRSASFLAAGGAAAVLLAIPGWAFSPANVPDAPLSRSLEPAAGWQVTAPSSAWQPEYLNPHELAHQGFADMAGRQVDLYAARYHGQQQRSKLIANANSLDDGWQRVASTSRKALVGGHRQQIGELTLASSGERRVVWYWYEVGGWVTHSRVRAKLLEAAALLKGRQDGTLVAISAACAVNCGNAEAALGRFLSDHDDQLQTMSGAPPRQVTD